MTKPNHACFLCDKEYDNPMDAIDCCSPAKRLKAASEIGQTFDPVNKPKHYNSHPSGVETITITEHMNFCLGNVIKYVMRCDLKNGTEDLEKARWYLDREIARRKKAHDV